MIFRSIYRIKLSLFPLMENVFGQQDEKGVALSHFPLRSQRQVVSNIAT